MKLLASLAGTILMIAGGRRLTHLMDPKSTIIKAGAAKGGLSSRRFIAYISSEWEHIWLTHVEEWAEKREICEVLNTDIQRNYMHDFLNLTCSVRYLPPHDNWCVIDDEVTRLYYNNAVRDRYEISWLKDSVPSDAVLADTKLPIIPTEEHEHIVSKFMFLDETTGEVYSEYIEPLVSHLRFPLAHCVKGEPEDNPNFRFHPIMFRGWIIPPPPDHLHRKKKIYFDAGASDWNHGSGGPSLDYFVKMWDRSEHAFDEIYAFEMNTPVEKFKATVPTEFKSITHYQQCAVSSNPEEDSDEHPFLPLLVKKVAKPDDYVLFKLDIDSPGVENGNIEFILNDSDPRIDELFWEHHVSGNYLMEEWGVSQVLDQLTLRESYEFFLQMRQKGIRAHSWV